MACEHDTDRTVAPVNRRAAEQRVDNATMAGKSAGNAAMSSSSARTPPVEAPMTIASGRSMALQNELGLLILRAVAEQDMQSTDLSEPSHTRVIDG